MRIAEPVKFLPISTCYRGRRARGASLVVVERRGLVERILLPAQSHPLLLLSGEFDWGYLGKAPQQLALGILLDFTRRVEIASASFQDFAIGYVAEWVEPAWAMPGSEIVAWLRQRNYAIDSLIDER